MIAPSNVGPPATQSACPLGNKDYIANPKQCTKVESLKVSHRFASSVIPPTKGTPWNMNMEPTNHSFRKENDLPNVLFSMLIFRGVIIK